MPTILSRKNNGILFVSTYKEPEHNNSAPETARLQNKPPPRKPKKRKLKVSFVLEDESEESEESEESGGEYSEESELSDPELENPTKTRLEQRESREARLRRLRELRENPRDSQKKSRVIRKKNEVLDFYNLCEDGLALNDELDGFVVDCKGIKKIYSQYEILILKNLYKRNTEIQIGIAPPRAKLENGECNPHHYYWYCTDLQKSHCNEKSFGNDEAHLIHLCKNKNIRDC